MGLGGIARDSIVGLNKIVQDDDNDDLPHSSRRHSNNGMVWTSGSDDSNAGEGSHKLSGFDVEGTGDGDDHEDVDSFPGRGLSRVASFHIPLTDGLASVGGTVATTTPSLSPSSINIGTTSTTPISSSSSSTKIIGNKSPSKNRNSAAVQQVSSRYQGFHYEGYADYYSDDFASYSFDEYSHSNSTDGSNASQQHQESKKNIFCCLFAPWMQHKAIIENKDEDHLPAVISSVQGGEEVGGTIESTTTASSDMVLESPTLTPTPSFDERISSPSATASLSHELGYESAPSNETLDLPNLHSNARTPKTTKNFVSANDVDELEPTASCFMPLDVGSSSLSISTGVDSSSSLPSSSHEGDHHPMNEEKKQEECDHELAHTTTPRDAPKVVVVAEDGQDKNEIPPPRPIKGILKVWCSTNSLPSTKDIGRKSVSTPMSPNKRQLFPTYEQKKKSSPGEENAEAKSIKFNPMARVLTIPSRNDIPLQQKAQVWWQKYDYDEFKKTGRIISKAMECGGSEIWLASSNAWGDKSARSSPRERATINGKHSEEYTKALSKYVNEPKKGSDDEGDNDENGSNFGNKWWCKFGHSRRGLEHVVSSSEGKARQQSVLMAIRMVMEEQKRQRASRTKDPNKLRSVAMQYTSWARDLALAAAAADAEAVASNFDPSAKCRAQHFAKRLNVNSSTLHTLHNSDIVGGGVAMAITSQILDANTHRTPIATTNTKKLVEQSLQAANTVEHNRTKDISLSKRAKGFMPGAVEDVSAAALLSGMGNMGFRSVKA
ncbi:hypothetical protein ACHAWU_006817 [Discostella pseudostelligera]|uniref:Uncharacterized protein n=1 Tax=Discostella pseudostelligera TaxID=259834 RepID=A0ABD3N0Y0_9STRA